MKKSKNGFEYKSRIFIYIKCLLPVALLLFSGFLFSQTGGTHPGYDPDEGMSSPIDGGILMAILAVGGLISMLFKKKKDKE